MQNRKECIRKLCSLHREYIPPVFLLSPLPHLKMTAMVLAQLWDLVQRISISSSDNKFQYCVTMWHAMDIVV